MKYKKVMDLSSERTKLFKNLLSSMKNLIHGEGKEEKARDIFTLPSYALPSQYRTLLPVKDVEIERLLTLERRRQLIRNVTLAISSVIVIFIIVIITIIIVLQLSLNELSDRGPLRLTAVRVNRTQFQVEEIKLLKSKASVKTSNIHEKNSAPDGESHGIRCAVTCRQYSAFRFKAQCVDGYCLCQDKNYDSVTCLPKSNDCFIKRHRYHPSFQAIRYGQVQTSYSCAPKIEVPADTSTTVSQTTSSPEIHVISIYGEKDAKFTKLHFKSPKKINVTLILVSYEPVTWNITLDATIYTEKIVLISHYGVSRTQVTISSHSNRTTEDESTSASHSNITNTPSSLPHSKLPSGVVVTSTTPANITLSNPIQIKRLLIRTGYGDDKNSGNTPFLLDQITKRIGAISSFFGVEQADEIVFDIGLGNYKLNSINSDDKDVYRTTYET